MRSGFIWSMICVLLVMIAFDLHIIKFDDSVNVQDTDLNKIENANSSGIENTQPIILEFYDNTTNALSNFCDSLSGKSSDYNLSYNIISIGGRPMPTKIKRVGDVILCDVIIMSTTDRSMYNVKLTESGDISKSIQTPIESLHSDGVLEPSERWTYHIKDYVTSEEASLESYQICFEVTGDDVNTLRESTDSLTSRFTSYTPKFGGNGYWVGGNGGKIVLRNNEDAKNPSYNELIDFISQDDTDKHAYLPNSFVCADFGETVHNNAEMAGIKAGWVTIDFSDCSGGHACNVFETTDKGLVFIDCTSSLTQRSGNWDSIVDVVVGKEYLPRHLHSDGSYYLSMGTVSDYQIHW